MARGIWVRSAGRWKEIAAPYVRGELVPPTSVNATLSVIGNGTYTPSNPPTPISQSTFDLSLVPGTAYSVSIGGTNIGLSGTTISSPAIDGVNVPIYPAEQSVYTGFLNSYGVWNTPNTSSVPAETITLIYNVYLASAGTYTLTASADNVVNSISFDNGSSVLSESEWYNTASTTVTLSAGAHTITIVATNNDNPSPASVGATLTNSSGKVVWSTRDSQVESSAVIQYTSESERALFSGGSIYTSGTTITHVFDSKGILTALTPATWNNVLKGFVNTGTHSSPVWSQFFPPTQVTCDVTLIGGGGGGGGDDRYPGIAGYPGYVVKSTISLNTTDTNTVYVGGGGNGGGSGGNVPGGNGGNDSGSGYGGGNGGNSGPEGGSGSGGGGGAASVLEVNGTAVLVAAGGGGGGGGGDYSPGRGQQGGSNNSTAGGAGVSKQADGGGGGGGGGGSPGGAGGDVYGGQSGPPAGGEDQGAYCGNDGTSLATGGTISSAGNNGGVSSNGGNGSVVISYTSLTGNPMFTGGDLITNNNGYITHTFTTIGSGVTFTGV